MKNEPKPCPECGSKLHQEWNWGYRPSIAFPQSPGTLSFFVGCTFCGETVERVTDDTILEYLNKMRYTK